MNVLDLNDLCGGCEYEEGDDICSECLRLAILDMVNGNNPIPDQYTEKED